ncbi:MAG: hypothetical protein V1936_05230 [Patescibacteria group bacterium]
MRISFPKLRRLGASLLTIAILALQLPNPALAAKLAAGHDSLSNSRVGETSTHSIVFTTQSALRTGDSIELSFPDFGFELDSTDDIIIPVGPLVTKDYSNSNKTISLTLTENFAAGSVEVAIADGVITNPSEAGEYLVRVATKNQSGAILDQGSATAEIANNVRVSANIIPVVRNVTSSLMDGAYWIGSIIPIQITFSGNVYVTGTPTLALNSDGTAFYKSGSGTDTLTFNYEIQDGDLMVDTNGLDYSSTTALATAGGSIGLANGRAANLLLPEPGKTGSLSANKKILIRPFHVEISSPDFFTITIVDDNGTTEDSTPLLRLTAQKEAAKVALSCDQKTWTNWIPFSTNAELNIDNHSDFDILKCGAEEGLKNVYAKFANSFGYESPVLSDSTIYKIKPKVVEPVVEKVEEVVKTEDKKTTETPIVTKEIDLSAKIKETKAVDPNANEAKIIEVGYVDPNQKLWKSFRDVQVDTNGIAVVQEKAQSAIEARVITADKLEKQTTDLKTSNPVLPKSGGNIPVKVELVSKGSQAKVEISAQTNVTNGGGGGSGGSGGSYEHVIYAPEVVETPPAITDTNLEINEAVFVGSSSGSINFDQPVLLTLPVTEQKEPRIYHFDETANDWVLTRDAKNGQAGGEVSADGRTISIWVDHMTLFAVVGVKNLKLVGIKKIAVGSGQEKRAEFESGEWFSPADIGNDDLVSFAWSGTGDRFYYVLDKNPSPTSLRDISDETKFTTEFYLDGIRVSEGESYFHILAQGANGERDGETVFVIDYDKTPPRLAKIVSNKEKISLEFSEAVSSNDFLTVYFRDGQILEIPAFGAPTDKIEIAFESETTPEIISIVGLLIDRAGLVAINPEPLTKEFTDGKIQNAQLTVLYPAQLVNGRYFTKKDFVNVIPQVEGATKMRLAANILGAENAWQDFTENEIKIPLTGFGAQKIALEFANASGTTKSAGIVITRLPASEAELSEMESRQSSVLSGLRELLSQKLKKLLVWGIGSNYEAALAETNPAILPASEIPTEAEIDNLNQAFATAREIRKLATEEKPSAAKIETLARKLADQNFTLDDFLSLAELDSLFAKISNEEADHLRGFLNLNAVALQKSDDALRVGSLSLGMRDSDDDGLSDSLEIELGSNPFLRDSDQDGLTDGWEVLQLGNNPLQADSAQVGFTNLPEKIEDPRPFLTGVSQANTAVRVIAVNSEKAEIELGQTTADARGAWQILSEVSLPAGHYELRLLDGTTVLATREIEINLDFILLPPKIFAGQSEVFADRQPAFFGNAFFGSRIVAFFDGNPTAVVIDNTLGDFVVRPIGKLADGKHVLTIWSELADGARSPARLVNFEVKTVELAPLALEIENFDSSKIAFTVGALLLAGLAGIWIFRRRSQVNP